MPPGLDLNVSFKITSDQIARIQFEYLNLIAAYMLHSLALSQSMGKLSAGFKNAKSMTKMLSQTFPALDEDEAPLPLVTRETFAYAMTLGIWCVCFKSDDDMFKGRPEAYYEKALKDLQGLGDEQWESLLKGLMLEYIGLVTSPEPPGPTAPPLAAPEVVANDAARAAARAAAAAAGGGGGGEAGGAGAGEEDDAAGAGVGADNAASAGQGSGDGDAEEAEEAQPGPPGKRGGRKLKAAGR